MLVVWKRPDHFIKYGWSDKVFTDPTDFGLILCLLHHNAGFADFLFFYIFIKKEKVGNCIGSSWGVAEPLWYIVKSVSS